MSRQSPNLAPPDAVRARYRVRFGKTGLLRWISHRDLATLFERVARRADLPLSMTEGFHQKPRMSFPSALPLGVESHDEVVEIELSEHLPAEELRQRLIQDEQPGLTIHSVTAIEWRNAKARMVGAQYRVTLPDEFEEAEAERVTNNIEAVRREGHLSIDRKGKTVTAEVATQIPTMQLRRDHLFIHMVLGDGASLKVTDLLQALKLGDWPDRGATIVRTRVQLDGDSSPSDPSPSNPLPHVGKPEETETKHSNNLPM